MIDKRQHWHLLDARAIWVKEFANALAKEVSLHAWQPDITWSGRLRRKVYAETLQNPLLSITHFPLQRGFARWPVRQWAGEAKRMVKRLQSTQSNAVLLCSSPHYADVARLWQGPVVYYMSDLYYAWGDDPEYINAYDRLMCQHATLVCPVSSRGRDYLLEMAGCPDKKIVISPMATRSENLLPAAPGQPGPLPADLADLPRPIIGVIGNLARNMDWIFLANAVARLPSYSWAFVGPTDMPVAEADHRAARQMLQQTGVRVRFVGYKPYGDLAAYARAVDISFLPYRAVEPTYSGSSTRFYEHLAACRPMLATKGFAELLEKPPLVQLVETVEEFVDAIQQLEKNGFSDGYEAVRWKNSQLETWETRAQAMVKALNERV